jgi:preprotein translocase subunit YajC
MLGTLLLLFFFLINIKQQQKIQQTNKIQELK